MAKVSFNGYEKLIIVNSGINHVDVGSDIYSEWKRWCSNTTNLNWLPALNVIGGDPISDTKKLGTTYFLTNNWKIRPYEGNHTLYIDGNLYADDGSLPYINTVGDFNVSILSTVSSIVNTEIVEVNSGGGTGTSNAYSNLYDVVYVDISSNNFGTAYPVGTKEYPVNNINNALTIAYDNNIENIKLLSDVTIGTAITGYTIHANNRKITLSQANLNNTTIHRGTVTGSVIGDVIFNNCTVYDLVSQNAEFNSCQLSGILTMHGDNARFISCYTVNYSDIVTLLMYSTSVANINIIAFTGTMLFKNSILDHIVNVNFTSGSFIVDSTCINGNVIMSGIVNLINYSQLPIQQSQIVTAQMFASNVMNYSMNEITDTTGNTLGGYIKNKLLTVFRFIGLK